MPGSEDPPSPKASARQALPSPQAPARQALKLTYDDFLLFPDDGKRHDETIKRRLYERSSVAEYRVVDPDIDVIRIYRRSGERFERPVELSGEADDVLATALLPGLEMPLARVFRD